VHRAVKRYRYENHNITCLYCLNCSNFGQLILRKITKILLRYTKRNVNLSSAEAATHVKVDLSATGRLELYIDVVRDPSTVLHTELKVQNCMLGRQSWCLVCLTRAVETLTHRQR